MPHAVVQPQDTLSIGAATAIIDALDDLGDEWEASFEGPPGDKGIIYRSRLPEPDWSLVVAEIVVVLAHDAIRLALPAIREGAEKWIRERRGATVEIAVIEKGTGERPHTIRVPERRP